MVRSEGKVKGEQAQAPATDVHTSPMVIGGGSGSGHQKTWLIGLVIAVLVIGGGSGLWFVHQHQTKDSKAPTVKTTKKFIPPIPEDQKFASTINTYITEHKYQQAIDAINARSDKATAERQAQLAGVYLAQANYSQALSIYDAINKTGKMTYAIAASAGYTAVQSGQKALAVQYYQQAIDLAKRDKTSATATSDAAELTTTLKQLQNSGGTQ